MFEEDFPNLDKYEKTKEEKVLANNPREDSQSRIGKKLN